MKVNRLLPAVIFVALTVPQPAQAQSGDAGSAAPAEHSRVASNDPVLATRYPRYEVQPGDVIDVVFAFTPEFNQQVTTQPDGYITLNQIGDVYVRGKTIPQLTEEITRSYSRFLHLPKIALLLKEFEKPHFVVDGQVMKPGKYDLRADTTVTEAVAIAGGLTDKAKTGQVLLFRKVSSDWVEVNKLSLKRIYDGELREDVHLRPGDMLLIPRSKISKIKAFLPTYSLGTYFNPAAK
ncbi:MAG: polysaccharide biosynthesis/export family protein [Terriglobales bacterium]